jgi:hypothetical protein
MPPLTLQIPAPCAESWDAMTPQGAGRHCASCQKVVVDFSQKTDAEILAILSTTAGGSTCGRFRGSQLSRPLRQPLPARHKGWSAAVAATLALVLGRSLTAPEARAQAPVTQHPADGRHSPEPEFQRTALRPTPTGKGMVSTVSLAAPSPRAQISGRVVDKDNGMGLPGVTVLLQGTQHGVSTDADGSFTLAVAPTEQQYAVLISYIGYETALLSQPENNAPMQIQLTARMLTGLMITYPVYTPRGVWSRVRSIPYRITNLFR